MLTPYSIAVSDLKSTLQALTCVWWRTSPRRHFRSLGSVFSIAMVFVWHYISSSVKCFSGVNFLHLGL